MTRTKDNSGNGQRQTSLEQHNVENEIRTEEMLHQLIGLKQMQHEFCRLYLLSLRGALRQLGVTPEMGELYEWEYSGMESLKASTADQLRILISFSTASSKNTDETEQPDMFGGLGHFDLEGVYHFD